MGKTLEEIAKQLQASPKKVQLIYAFNGVGKTRLLCEFKQLIQKKPDEEDDTSEHSELAQKNILYYSAFTEDLFYWDNNLDNDSELRLNIQPNSFTNWILKDQGKDQHIIADFQRFGNDKLTPSFSPDFSSVTFSFKHGDNQSQENIKISKGEESNFIWSIFYSLIKEAIEAINERNKPKKENPFHNLQYVFIDDPVTSLDENHLIELAVNLAQLIKSSEFTDEQGGVRFIITTHNALFYNVFYNELSLKAGYILEKNEDGSFEFAEKRGDSNKSFSYHLYLKQIIKKAIEDNAIEKYHFALIRNLYERTASFLGYPKWSELLPSDGREGYLSRIINFTSHSTLSTDTVSQPSPEEKRIIGFLLNHLNNNYNFWQEGSTTNE